MDVDMIAHYSAPTDYNPPTDEELNGNSQFPNLNSVEYRNRPQADTINLLPFYERLEANQDQTTILLTTNSYTQRLWNGTVMGFERFGDVGKRDASIIQLGFDANLTGCRFIDKTMVLFTTANGTIQLWSTQSEIRNKNGYNLYQVSKKSEHIGPIISLCVMNNRKAITGATDGCLKVWQLDPCDIVSEQTYRHAHKQVITDVTTKPQSNDIFASCSRDRYLSIWDKRCRLPMVDFCKNDDYANTACLWSAIDGVERLYLGDDTGTMHLYDPRQLNKLVKSHALFDRPIYTFKMHPTEKMLCVFGLTTTFKVIDTTDDANTLYTDSRSNDYVRDVCWKACANQSDQMTTKFYSVGWNRNVHQHNIQSNSPENINHTT